MSPSTRSGKTYSEASSITSSRRSSTTRSVRGRKPQSTAQVDADPIGGGQDQPTAEGHNPSSIKERKTRAKINLAGTVQIDSQEESRIVDSQDIADEKRRETIGIIRPIETTDEADLDPTIIREGQEETDNIRSHTNVDFVEETNAIHRGSTIECSSPSSELPRNIEESQQRSDPTVGLNGHRPTGGSRPERRSGSFDGYRTNESVFEDQACRIYRQQYHMYETAKKAKQHADATRALTECQRSYRNISKKLTWQFALSINNGWNPFKEAKSAKLLAKLEGRSQPTASGSRPSGSYNSSGNQRGKRPAETDINQLGKIPKLDTSWRETMAAARALQQARAQVLEELRKEEEASKRRKKE
ncbi:hypothetical protein PGT21_014825 [Puccinia graminis f. sp. tritici]|uniref:Uncharacterized protein n=1 Tax=Puccinia graminis f. sp. tritici TaxID=56615 RepID=A0A5B0MF69_PUCGR|nr:hypothetical protein PGT21_014825 [Puccinia graminis f. sp. tritici]